jgi:hypothetical protein
MRADSMDISRVTQLPILSNLRCNFDPKAPPSAAAALECDLRFECTQKTAPTVRLLSRKSDRETVISVLGFSCQVWERAADAAIARVELLTHKDGGVFVVERFVSRTMGPV